MLAASYATAAVEPVRALVAAQYDLGPIGSCLLLSRGFNDIYAIAAAAGRFVFRISGVRARGPADVADETAFIAHLAAGGVPVAQAVPTRTGALFLEVAMPDATRPGVLFQEAPGRAPALDDPPDAAAQGRTLAQLHDAAGTFPGTGGYALDAERLLWLPQAPIAALGSAPETVQALAALATRLEGRLEAAAPGLARLRLHGDCHGINARIGADGRATFFDFDEGGHGFLAYDLAVHLWAQVSFGRRRFPMWHAFVAGYRAVRPIAPADLAAVELFVPMRHLWLMGEYCGLTTRWGREAITPGWVERELAWLLAWERERLGARLC